MSERSSTPEERPSSPLLDHGSIVVLDADCDHLDDALALVAAEVESRFALSVEQRILIEESLFRHGDAGVDTVENGVAIIHDQLRGVHVPAVVALVRMVRPLPLGEADDPPARFLWVLLSMSVTHPWVSTAAEFAQLMRHSAFRQEAERASSRDQLLAAYERALDEDLHFVNVPIELRATGRLFGGMARDLRRRLPDWLDDWRSGLHVKVLASVLFMFFACLAPAVAFGGLLSTLTDGHIGAVETVVASAVCGILWSIFAGQPLAIVGATGPNVIFTGILYALCVQLDAPFLPTVACTGLWAGLFMIVLAALDASALIRYFTRFSDEIFAALIALIFVTEAVNDIVRLFQSEDTASDTALLSLILAAGTFALATSMSRIRRSPYLRARVRDFLSDFGPAIALVTMSLVAWRMHWVELPTLAVPDTLVPTLDRSWMVSPLDAPLWVMAASALPALLLTILIWTNQNITARLVNSPDFSLRRGPAFHWDIAVMGVLVALMGMFGLPWVVGAVVRSLNHVRSLAVEQNGRVVGVVENRLSNLAIHLLIGVALLLFLPLLGKVPMAVLFGMFLFMGLGTISGNQFLERVRLWILDPARYPPVHYVRAVPARRIHAFTAVQLACLAMLWIVKASAIGILFPFFLALLVPIRLVLSRFFKPEHLALLDAEEVPKDDEFRDFGA